MAAAFCTSFKRQQVEVLFDDKITGINFSLSAWLAPLGNIRNDSIEWIGTSSKEYDLYDIVSFRIEEEADILTVMERNINMQWHVVLFIGVRIKETNDIIYFQKVLDNESGFLKELYSEIGGISSNNETLLDLRNKYYDLKSANDDNGQIIDTNLYSAYKNEEINKEEIQLFYKDGQSNKEKVQSFYEKGQEDSRYDNFNGFEEDYDIIEELEAIPDYGEKTAVCNVLPPVSDSIFKTNPLQKWFHKEMKKDGKTYVYSYISYQMAGTKNRETHIIISRWIKTFVDNFLTNQFKIEENACVLYVNNTRKLGKSLICRNPIKYDSITLTNKIKNTKGYCTFREQYASINSSTSSNIIKCVISWFKYPNKVATMVRTLTGKAANDSCAYEEADKVSCEEATSKSMFKVEDYVYLRMQCANTKQYEFDYFFEMSER